MMHGSTNIKLKYPVPSAHKTVCNSITHINCLSAYSEKYEITYTVGNIPSGFMHKRVVYTAYSTQVLFRDCGSTYLFMYLFIYLCIHSNFT